MWYGISWWTTKGIQFLLVFFFIRILRVMECIEIQLKAHIEKMERTELIIY